MRTRGFTLIELLIVIGVISIMAGIAIPWAVRNRLAGHEASAIHSLTTINDSQAAYRETCGKGRYAATLSVLGRPHPATGEPYLSPDLTAADEVVKSGYIFRMTGTAANEPHPDCNGVETVEGYAVTADPSRPGSSGTRYFATNTTRVIYEHTESLVGQMPEAGPPAVGIELRR